MNENKSKTQVKISVTKITSQLIFVVSLISIISILADTFDTPNDIERVLSVGREKSIPTWYASSTLLICSVLLLIIAHFKKKNDEPFVRHWRFLGFLFLFFSIDEVATIHEMTTVPVRDAFNLNGVFYFAWVIPGILLALAVFISYFKFLQHLPKETRRLFIFSGAVFIIGAVGFESVSAYFYESYQAGTMSVLAFERLTDIEELLEMTGVLLFIYTLVSYMQKALNRIEIRIESN